MDVSEQIKRFEEFIDQNYSIEVIEAVTKGEYFLVIDFNKLSRFNPELADILLDQPEEVLKAFEIAVKNLESVPDSAKKFSLRFKNLPKSQEILIRDIRSPNINKLICIDGIVRQKSDVRPQVTTAKFECPGCGNIMTIIQLESKFKEPSRCGCGRKGKFRLIHKELVDAQKIVLEENSEKLEGGDQPKRMDIFLKNDLVSPLSDKKTNPGTKVQIVGLVKEVPIPAKDGGQLVRFDLIVEANMLQPLEESFGEIKITKEEKQKILDIAKDPKVTEKLINSMAPSIYGHDKVKEAIILQLLGGVKKTRTDGAVTRGDMHILLVGDPGAGKSQLLKRAQLIAPKSRYVSGKGASGAGLTAAVVKDDFLRGWALEAGALVLANKGFVMIDELDKMSKEDTSAMHEALEQQSYHPDTELLFSDGSIEKIGTFVDNYIKNNRKKVVNGKNCEILYVNNVEILTTDFQNIFPAKINSVSRHLAPDSFLKIEYSNGRSITVTSEHPIFIFKDGEIKTVAASEVKEGCLAPCPVKLPTKNRKTKLIPQTLNHHNNKPVFFPTFVDESFSRLLGYIATEGHSYYNPNTRYAEIGISNTDKKISEECTTIFENIFHTTVNINTRAAKFSRKATKDLDTVRCCSIPFYNFFKENFSQMAENAPKKRAGNIIRRLEKTNIKEFLRTAFKGDGFVDGERFGFSTSSIGLAKDYQDLLLQNNIWSYISREKAEDKEYYKVVISGSKNMRLFLREIVEENDHRQDRIKKFCQRAEGRLNNKNPVPCELIEKVDKLLKSFGLSTGYFHKILKKKHNSNRAVVEKYLKLVETRLKECRKIVTSSDAKAIRKIVRIPVKEIAEKLQTSVSNVYYLESNKGNIVLNVVKKIAEEKNKKKTKEFELLNNFVMSDLQLVTIKNVEYVKNTGIKWVYDVSVEPTKTFVSEGLILHNSVSISKANIQATLRCETTVLAAANPKWGRFDPYEILGKQINLPSPLISRFDLIFPIRDLPNKEQDERLATFLLNLHQTSNAGACDLETDMLKKFIAYARRTCVPKLTDDALEELKNYYVRMRNSGGDEGAVKAIPITARQLEALVRLAEASAKTRLSDKVLKKDALKAIELLHFCMSQVGVDPDTGKIDIDVLTTGVSSSARSNIIIIKEVINELENKIGKTLPVEDIIKEAQEKGVSADKAEEVLEKLKRAGDVFEPKRGFVQKI